VIHDIARVVEHIRGIRQGLDKGRLGEARRIDCRREPFGAGADIGRDRVHLSSSFEQG
jgi:hypothetical protein